MVLFCPFLALLWPTQHNFRNWSLTPWRQSGCTMGYIFSAKCIKLLWHHNDAIVGYAQEVMRIRKYSAPRGDICAQSCVPVLGCAYPTMGSLRCHNRYHCYRERRWGVTTIDLCPTCNHFDVTTDLSYFNKIWGQSHPKQMFLLQNTLFRVRDVINGVLLILKWFFPQHIKNFPTILSSL